MKAYNPEGALSLSRHFSLAIVRPATASKHMKQKCIDDGSLTKPADPPRSDAPGAPGAQQTSRASTSDGRTSPVVPPSSDPASNPEPSSVATTDRRTDPASLIASCPSTNAEPLHTAISDRPSGTKSPVAPITSEVQSAPLDSRSPSAPEQHIAEQFNLP